MHRIIAAFFALSLAASACGRSGPGAGGMGPTPDDPPATSTPSGHVIERDPRASDPEPSGPVDLTVTSFAAAVVYEEDGYEPNDSSPVYLGAAPLFTDRTAYIHGRHIEYTSRITNLGEGTARDVSVALFADADEPGSSDPDVVEVLDEILPGETRDLTLTLPYAAPGDYDSWILVDSTSAIEETDESNNVGGELDADVSSDEDWFEVYQDESYLIDIRLDELPADYDMELYYVGPYAAPYFVAGSYHNGTSDEQISGYAPDTGYYQLVIYGYDNAADDDEPYTLDVSLY